MEKSKRFQQDLISHNYSSIRNTSTKSDPFHTVFKKILFTTGRFSTNKLTEKLYSFYKPFPTDKFWHNRSFYFLLFFFKKKFDLALNDLGG